MTETVTYLEMKVEGLVPGREPDRSLALRQLAAREAEQAGWLYRTVGADWNWVDRAGWNGRQWLDHLSLAEIELWQLSDAGAPAGYFELRKETADRFEIAAFGLVPSCFGRGLGGHLLTLAVRRAAAAGASSVWLHTSTFDHPHALSNYQARGFRVVRTETVGA